MSFITHYTCFTMITSHIIYTHIYSYLFFSPSLLANSSFGNIQWSSLQLVLLLASTRSSLECWNCFMHRCSFNPQFFTSFESSLLFTLKFLGSSLFNFERARASRSSAGALVFCFSSPSLFFVRASNGLFILLFIVYWGPFILINWKL